MRTDTVRRAFAGALLCAVACGVLLQRARGQEQVPEPVLTPLPEGFPDPVAPAPAPVATAPAPGPARVPTSAAKVAGSCEDDAATAVSFAPGQGLGVVSRDGAYSLRLSLAAQLRDELSLPTAAGSARRNALYVARARVVVTGNVFDEATLYWLALGFAPADVAREPAGVEASNARQLVDASGRPLALTGDRDLVAQSPLLDLYVELAHLRDAALRVGQSNLPYSRERLTSYAYQPLVDRSAAELEMALPRDIGVSLRSTDWFGLGLLRYDAGVFSGEGRNASGKTFGAGDLGLLYLGRLELTALGPIDGALSGDFARALPPRLALGVAYALLQSDATSPYAIRFLGQRLGTLGEPALVDFNAHNLTADVTLRGGGVSALAAFYYRKVTPVLAARDGIGATLQAAYLLSARWPLELAGRLSLLRRAGSEASSLPESSELAAGANYYFHEHGLKLQGDYAHLWPQGAGAPENRVRLQLQVIL